MYIYDGKASHILVENNIFICFDYRYVYINYNRGIDSMVVGFTTTSTISAHHH